MPTVSAIIKKYNEYIQEHLVVPDEVTSTYIDSLSNDEIAQLALKDYLTTFNLLKHANQQRPGQVTSVASAINSFGGRSIINGEHKLNYFSNGFVTFSYRKKSLFKAIATTKLLSQLKTSQATSPEVAFLSGLLSSIGNMPILSFNPKYHYSEHLSDDTYPWIIQEKLTGFNQFDYSYELLDFWKIPKEICLPIKYFMKYDEIQTNPYLEPLFMANLLSLPFVYPEYFRISKILDHEVFFRSELPKDWFLDLYKQTINATSSKLFDEIPPNKQTFPVNKYV